MTTTLPDVLPSIGYAAPPRFHPAIWPITTHSDDEGRLCIGEVPLTNIADEFRTPCYVIDEADFRGRVRRYRAALPNTEVVYAGKSLLSIAVARWAREEGLGVDVCSAGELAAVLAAGVEKARIIMHGNAKSQDESRAAVRNGVGRIVLDSCSEITDLATRIQHNATDPEAHRGAQLVLRLRVAVHDDARFFYAAGQRDGQFTGRADVDAEPFFA